MLDPNKLIKTTAPAVTLDGTDPKALANLRNSDVNSASKFKGVDNDILIEPVPKYIEAACEKVIKNGNNSWIVLGRDRPGPRSSGYGGKGDTGAGSIDLCVGRLADKARSFDKSSGEALLVDPDFKVDSARVYISQKTDIDENFGLVAGTVGNSKAKSGIGIKADAIRLVAREGIKLVTSESTKNSRGGDIQKFVGVDIIAGNVDDIKTNSDLQPMPKGANLAEALERLTTHVEKLNGIVDSLVMTQMQFNTALKDHWHHSPFFAQPTAPSTILIPEGAKCISDLLTKVKQSLLTHKANLANFKQTYLKQSGKKYINSRFNNVN
jgi:hypothetical protein